MRVAIPLVDGKLSLHFGHCERFAVIDADPVKGKVLKKEEFEAPEHQPGLLPAWLAEKGVKLVIAGGMGQRAINLFTERGIEVIIGAPSEEPETLVGRYLDGTLKAGENVCDH